jgi:MYXO-CTERM domain-containing protein
MLEDPVCAVTNIARSSPLAARYLPLVAAQSSKGGSVLGQSDAGAFARVLRRTGVAGVLVCVATGVAASAALAERGPQPDPSELWRSYPLEQKPTTVATPPAAAAPSRQRNGQAPTSSASDKPGGGPSWGVILGVAAPAGLLALAAIALRRRRRQAVAPAPVPVPAPSTQRAAQPAAGDRRRAAASPNGRAAAARTSPVCQIRWNRRGRWFYAVSVDPAGVEHMVASARRLEWHGSAPPEETPDARAAIRKLAKELRERGWRPLRTKGIDFDERRWYARRFRWPTEEELRAGGEDPADTDSRVAGRSGGSR